MQPAPAVTRTGTRSTVRVPAVTCPACEDTFTRDGIPTGPHKGWFGRRHAVEATACAEHPASVRVTAANDSTVLLFAPFGLSTAGNIIHLLKVADQVRVNLQALAEKPAKFGVWEDAPAAEVEATTLWVACGDTTVRGRRAWEAAGFTDPLTLSGWHSAMGATAPGLDGDDSRESAVAADAAAWRDAGYTATKAHGWRLAGCTPRTTSRQMSKARFWAAAHLARVPATEEWGALCEVANGDFMRAGLVAGQEPSAVAALADAIKATHDFPKEWHGPNGRFRDLTVSWPMGHNAAKTMLDIATHVGDRANWSLVARCLRGGLDVEDAVEHVSAGRDMTAIDLMAALA